MMNNSGKAWENGNPVSDKEFVINLSGFKEMSDAVTQFETYDLNSNKTNVFTGVKFFYQDWNITANQTAFISTFKKYVVDNLYLFVSNQTINGTTISVGDVTLAVTPNEATFSVTFDNCILTPGGAPTSKTLQYKLSFNQPLTDINLNISATKVKNIVESHPNDPTAIENAVKELVKEKLDTWFINNDSKIPNIVLKDKDTIIQNILNAITISYTNEDGAEKVTISGATSDGFTLTSKIINIAGNTASDAVNGNSVTILGWWPWLALGIFALFAVLLTAYRFTVSYREKNGIAPKVKTKKSKNNGKDEDDEDDNVPPPPPPPPPSNNEPKINF